MLESESVNGKYRLLRHLKIDDAPPMRARCEWRDNTRETRRMGWRLKDICVSNIVRVPDADIPYLLEQSVDVVAMYESQVYLG